MGQRMIIFVIALSGFGEYFGFRNHGESNGKENGKCHGLTRSVLRPHVPHMIAA